jgi:hypothetical protein
VADDEQKFERLREAVRKLELAGAKLEARDARPNRPHEDLYCSFCGKTRTEVRALVEGPDVFICDECVKRCQEILLEGGVE